MIEPGRYLHRKTGRIYVVTDWSLHTETEEVLVNYMNLKGQRFSRPLSMFTESVEVRGVVGPRFQKMEESHRYLPPFTPGSVSLGDLETQVAKILTHHVFDGPLHVVLKSEYSCPYELQISREDYRVDFRIDWETRKGNPPVASYRIHRREAGVKKGVPGWKTWGNHTFSTRLPKLIF